jgi:5-methylcytosine-specific restriction endonuclease McrA
MNYTYPFTDAAEDLKLAVWNKAEKVTTPDMDPTDWRKDICGKLMKYSEHGNIDTALGWEIDHIKPLSQDGGDDIENLQPLQWRRNREKGDTSPWQYQS